MLEEITVGSVSYCILRFCTKDKRKKEEKIIKRKANRIGCLMYCILFNHEMFHKVHPFWFEGKNKEAAKKSNENYQPPPQKNNNSNNHY